MMILDEKRRQISPPRQEKDISLAILQGNIF
jgi:hypothetical protein